MDETLAEMAAGESRGGSPEISTFNRLLSSTFKLPDGSPYIRLETEGQFDLVMLDDKSATDIVAYQRYLDEGVFGEKKDIKADVEQLRLLGKYSRPVLPIAHRVQFLSDRSGIELKIDSYQSVVVTAEAIKIGKHQGCFWQPPHELPLVSPLLDDGVSIDPFFDALGIQCADLRVLITGVLLVYLYPKGPYPILLVKGPQGSGKTTLVSFILELIDNSTLKTISNIENPRDLFVIGGQKHILSFDNVSDIPKKMSDAYCTVATGVQRAERQLYSNREMASIKVENPQIINGIPSLLQRDDFRERSVLIELPVIEQRLTNDEVGQRVKAALPAALGYLLKALQEGIRQIDQTETPQGLRMAGAARLVTAAEPALGWPSGTFVDAYRRNQLLCIELNMLEQPLYGVLRTLLDQNDGRIVGSAEEILNRLTTCAERSNRRLLSMPSWPKAENALSAQLNRLEGTLHVLGISVLFSRVTARRTITITDRNMIV